MRFFLAGIVQGSRSAGIHGQQYRQRIKAAVRSAFPEDEVYCPMADHPNSVRYAEKDARETFFDLMSRAAQADVLIAYLPEASMGTAIEMWEASRAGRRVIAISSLGRNWVVRFLADAVFESLEDFEAGCADGRVRAALRVSPSRTGAAEGTSR